MKLEEVLHMYLGCKVEVTSIETSEKRIDTLQAVGFDCASFKESPDWWLDGEENETIIRPILRRLEDMSEAEALDICEMQSEIFLRIEVKNIRSYEIGFEFEYASSRRRRGGRVEFSKLSSYQMQYLLSRGFDLFGLIDSGLALDSKTLNR